MKRYIIIGLFLIFLIGCKKECTTTISFTFIENYTNQPISNYKILLSKLPFGFDVFLIPIDTLTTDVNGMISYSFKSDNDHLYYLSPTRNNNYGTFNNIELMTCTSNTQTVKVKKTNCLKINLIDSSNIYYAYAINVLEDLASPGLLNGNCKDTSLAFTNCTPDGSALVSFNLFKGLIDTSKASHSIDTTIFMTKTDTVEITLKY
jgi:hypothetical protein